MAIRLTETVKKGGCAAKIAALELKSILGQVHFPPKGADILVDGSTFDDAAVIKVSDELALVQTLDFFTPIVDSPKIFGRVAAANALSDVYAMGATPKTAMAILAFPLADLDASVVSEVLQGACDVMKEAQVSFVGGHSIDDDTLKFGLSVTGYVHPDRVWTNAKARPGDSLILTKPLGTGALSAALKRKEVEESQISDALEAMGAINNILDLVDPSSVHSATDITGFGLLGHILNMAQGSGVDIDINFNSVPRFEKALELIEAGFLTKAHHSNGKYVEEALSWGDLNQSQRYLLLDPQTSGGLLLSVDSHKAADILSQIQKRFGQAQIIGQVKPKSKDGTKIHCH